MNRQKKAPKIIQSQVQQKSESFLPDVVLNDLKTCFDYYDKNKRDQISRDNVKSIMENFGWLNRPNKEIESCIDSVFPSMDDKRKKEMFAHKEVIELIAEFWVKRGYMENEFSELFAIFDKK